MFEAKQQRERLLNSLEKIDARFEELYPNIAMQFGGELSDHSTL